MKLKTIVASMMLCSLPLSVMAQNSVPVKPGYFPLIIKNDTQDTFNIQDVYLLALGKEGAKQCAMSFSAEKVGGQQAEVATCNDISANMDTKNYTYSVSKLPAYDASSQSVLLYIPHVISGRAYVSLNNKLTFPIVKTSAGDYAFQSPNMNNKSDPNYNILFDKFEYTYDDTNTFWINPTAVDFFAIPITLQSFDQKKISGAPLSVARNDLLNTIITTIQSHDETPKGDWNNVIVKDISGRTDTVLRVAAPYVAPDFPIETYLAQPDNNYIQMLIKYYKTHEITIDCIELAGDKYAPIHDFYNGDTNPQLYQFTGKVEDIDGEPTFVFVNNPPQGYKAYNAINISLNDTKAISTGFFMPGQEPFSTANHSVKSVIVKNLTAAFSAGLLPADDQVVLNSAFFKAHKDSYYRDNPLIDNNGGPWYDLYSKGIHAAIPITYAYAYDDVLGQDGTLNSQNNAEPIVVTIGNMGGVPIPNPYTPAGPTHAQPVTGVSNSGFSCSGGFCTLKATWTVPTSQDEAARYFILPQQFQGTSPAAIINQQNLLPATALGGVIKLPQDEVLNMQTKIQVFTCIPNSKSYTCPSKSNDDDYTKAIGSMPF